MIPNEHEADRGRLRGEAGLSVDLRRLRPGRRKGWSDLGLWQLEGAMEFNGDAVLANPEAVVCELRMHEAGDTLCELAASTQHSIAQELGGGKPGRPRMRGHWPLAFLCYVMSACPAVQPWWGRTSTSGVWKACGFDRRPAYSETHLRFGELERQWKAFATVTQGLIRHARDREPLIGQIIGVDATQWHSPAALEHCCMDTAACQGTDGAAHKLRRDVRAVLDGHWKETDAPEPLKDDDHGRNRQDVVWVRRANGHVIPYQRYFVDGHWFRSLDVSSGLRKYENSAFWFGGYLQLATDMFSGASLAAEVFPADVQEYDHYPALLESVVQALGQAPYIVSVDRGYAISPFYEFNTRRGVAVVSPFRNQAGMEREDWRTDAYDEDGIPRCRACGGEGDQNGPGLGLVFAPDGEPMLRYRCLTQIHSACEQTQSIACSARWPLLLPLSRKTELWHSVRHAHHNTEHVFRHIRDRYAVAGKDGTQRLRRAGGDAQRLRAWAGLLLDWFRLSLRQGWLEAQTFEIQAAQCEPKRLSGIEDAVTGEVLEYGVGSASLGETLARREGAGLDVSYGSQWMIMKKRLALEAQE